MATPVAAASCAKVVGPNSETTLERVNRWSVMTWTAPLTISQPVALRNPPITG